MQTLWWWGWAWIAFCAVSEVGTNAATAPRAALLIARSETRAKERWSLRRSKSGPSVSRSADLLVETDDPYYIPKNEVQNALLLRNRIKSGLVGSPESQTLPSVSKPSSDPASSPIAFRQPWWLTAFPKINLHFDPLVNFKLKQRLSLRGASVTLGLDYLSDVAQWRSYCTIEDSLLKGRFSLRGSELGWAKSWLLRLGLGEEPAVKLKLRFGLSLQTARLYAKLRFRTEPLSPIDLGEGLTCAGKLPLPIQVVPLVRSLPLRVEYRLRVQTASQAAGGWRKPNHPPEKVAVSTGLGAVDLSLDELNFCLEWDELSPLWNIGLVRSDAGRRVRGVHSRNVLSRFAQSRFS